jgi:hypothetical protein
MDVFLTDTEIQALINMKKQMTVEPDLLFLSMKEKRGHKSANMKCLNLTVVHLLLKSE